MAFRTCWRCLSRIAIPNCPFVSITPQHTAAFTTSASVGRNQASHIAGQEKRKFQARKTQPPDRRSRNFRVKKKPVVQTGRKPLPGERKALRKKVVLSNANALEVQGMQDITAESIVDEQLRGQVLGIPSPLINRLLAVDAFKPRQGWSLFRRPGTLIRKQTWQYGKLIEHISKNGVKRSLRRVLVGERGSGKTTMLLQVMTMAFLHDWVVINLPDGTNPITYNLPSPSQKISLRQVFLTKA